MRKRNGFLLVGVMLLFMFLLIIVPVMLKWVQDDTKIAVKDQKSSMAFNLAEAAVDRGYWKVKSSVDIFNTVMSGTDISGYHFDATYSDVSGGTYRVDISSGPNDSQVTITGEGRDSASKETRAIQAVYTNNSVPAPVLSGGQMNADNVDSVNHWGPMMAKGDIVLVTGYPHYPRKLSQGTVRPLDTTGDTNPPNTDSLEWWSNYNVPDLPIFDFVAMKSSAAATGTLNCQDATVTCTGTACNNIDSVGNASTYCTCTVNTWKGSACTDSDGGASGCSCSGSGSSKQCKGDACTGPAGASCVNTVTKACTGSDCIDTDGAAANCSCTPASGMQCCRSSYFGGPITCDYGGTGCTNCTLSNNFHQLAYRDKDYTWFWDDQATQVTWQGYIGIRGTVVVKGNMSIVGDKDDRYCRTSDTDSATPPSPGCTVSVPPQAWKEYQKFDTTASDEYPGDLGYHTNALTYKIGTSSTESGGSGGDLGIYGLLYVKGNLSRAGATDIYGAMWVEGTVSGTDNTMVFYNSKLKVPTLNVVFTRDSWQEVPPSTQAWP